MGRKNPSAYGIAGLLGAAAFIVSLLVVQAAREDVGDWTSHYVSDLANGTLGWLFMLGTALHGIGNLVLGAGLRGLADGERLGRWAAFLFSLAAAGILAVAFLPADGPGKVPTAIGLAHRAVVGPSFVLELAALFLFSAAFAAMPAQRRRGRVSLALAVLAAFALLAFALAALTSRLPGVAERLALASFLAWEAWAAATLLAGERRVDADQVLMRAGAPGVDAGRARAVNRLTLTLWQAAGWVSDVTAKKTHPLKRRATP